MTSTYFDIYMNQLFYTLGQLSAVLVSGAVAVPMVTYYNGSNFKLNYLNPNYWSKRTDKSKDLRNNFDGLQLKVLRENKNSMKLNMRVDGELFVDGDIRCSGDVLTFCSDSLRTRED